MVKCMTVIVYVQYLAFFKKRDDFSVSIEKIKHF